MTQGEIEKVFIEIYKMCKDKKSVKTPYDPCPLCPLYHLCYDYCPDEWSGTMMKDFARSIHKWRKKYYEDKPEESDDDNGTGKDQTEEAKSSAEH